MAVLTLARTFREPNPDRFAARLSERHLAQWQKLEALDPSSEQRADLRAAIIAQVVYSSTARREPRDVQSFMAVKPGTREDRMALFRRALRSQHDDEKYHR